ncbi:hypothetical protein R83H12_00187 [Fibrobacteria bacterium R8-3-H12]
MITIINIRAVLPRVLLMAVLTLALAFTISCGEHTFSSYNAEKCGDKEYNSNEFSCVVVSKCSGLYYNPDHQICRDGKIESIAFSSSGNSSSSSSIGGVSSSNSDGSSSSGDSSSSSIYDGSSSSSSSGGSSSSGDSSSSSIHDVSSSSNSGNSSSSGSNACVTWGNWIQTTAPTCDAAGTETRTCTSDPSKTETRGIAQLVWGEWKQTTAPTCDEAGMETRTCASDPSKTETREIAQLVWGPWVEITAATSTEHAKGKETCPNGDERESYLAVCNGVEYAEAYQRCGTGNVIQNKCGANDWYNPLTQFCQTPPNAVQNLCGGHTFTEQQRCGTGNVIETKCGTTGWYNASNANLDCQSNVVVTKCGNGWVNPSTQFCQLGTNTVQSLCNGQTFMSNQRCTSNVIETKCGSSWYDASSSNLNCQNNVVMTKCGSGWVNHSTQFCQQGTNTVQNLCGGQTFTTEEQCCGGNKYTLATNFCYNNSRIGAFCGERTEVFDPDLYECRTGNKIYLKNPVYYEGKNYNAVLIGTQTWMTENLNYNVENSKCATEDRGISDDNTALCDIYGRIYNWSTAMNIGDEYNTQNYPILNYSQRYKGICPSGWHIPVDDEWRTLMSFIIPSCRSGSQCPESATKLKSDSLWAVSSGTDVYGFTALPGPFGNTTSSRTSKPGSDASWWAASNNTDKASVWQMLSTRDYSWHNFSDKQGYLYSVRCVKD